MDCELCDAFITSIGLIPNNIGMATVLGSITSIFSWEDKVLK